MPVFRFFILLGAAAGLAAGQSFLREVSETNVNQRYLIESVSLGGVELDQLESSRVPARLRDRLKALIGENCDMAALEDLAADIRRELHFHTVSEHLLRGSAPDRIKVDFDAAGRDESFDVSVPRLLYTSQEKGTGEIDANIGFEGNKLTVGAVSNGDDLVERYTGLTARLDTTGLGTDRLHGSLTFEDYRETWNTATQFEAGATVSIFIGPGGMSPRSSPSSPRGQSLYQLGQASSRWNSGPQRPTDRPMPPRSMYATGVKSRVTPFSIASRENTASGWRPGRWARLILTHVT